jgi:hypothetical protein
MDEFKRDGTVGGGFPAEWVAASSALVDRGTRILERRDQLRPAGTLRDTVLGGELRRSLVTAKAINMLASGRLIEPTYATFRTLVDLELKVLYVVSDRSDMQAAKLVVYQYNKSKSVGTALMDDTATRTALAAFPSVQSSLRSDLGVLKRAYRSAAFEEARKELEKSPSWHGKASVEEAFRSIGAIRSYTQEFVLTSEYVHGDSPDRDFVLVGETLTVAPLFTPDDYAVGKILGMTGAKLLSILAMFIADRPIIDLGGDIESLLAMRNPILHELLAEAAQFLHVFERFLGPRDDANGPPALG